MEKTLYPGIMVSTKYRKNNSIDINLYIANSVTTLAKKNMILNYVIQKI